ncbi:conserved hypothetical protein [Leishmania major strain Friedlin]|uniref:Uncharacterized protein n=1 Tax=Leishmania major TaxID=5664 RepID=E9AE85_LEIMA|nr:conserved hypothetical protein [Leishmania major strain Friedlin]CAG9577964.1 hypothetical_protein_-_conserved [Leishmania major strain Friedlin]CBZ12564.1 conserved hypothetical protein [Leishmania major strain Friedlin]|eukprot:XP_003722306.1 conserved hypothetical protein [Leishmania major strain Friedlin]
MRRPVDMRTATVLGAGELGKACACALAANRSVDFVTLLTRDAAMAAPEKATATLPSMYSGGLANFSGAEGSSAGASSSPAAPSSITATPWPSVVHMQDLKQFCRDAASAINRKRAQHPLFLCTPCASYLPGHDAWARAAFGNEHCPATHDVLTRWRSAPAAIASLQSEPAPFNGFVAVFTRGFAANGAVPAQLADALLNGPLVEHASSAAPGSLSEIETPVLVASGPVLAKEWSLQSTPLASSGASATLSSPIPSRPPSALSAATGADGGASEIGTKAALPSASGRELPHAFSGVALTFASWTPSIAADTGRQEALAEQLRLFFPRESVTYLTAPDAAAILAIVNGCVPLCSFGAGLVSSVYTGTSVTSLAAYAQHAVAATEQLVNKLLGRAAGTPLPLPAVSTLWCACTCLVSREFALGRKLDFYFRKQDAAEAIFRGHEHHLFAATVDGLHERMQASGVASPFYEVLMDTYNTMIRASRTGEGLVKEGYYGYRDTLGEESGELLGQVTRVDQAMLSGDEARFTEAKERIMKAFAGSTF